MSILHAIVLGIVQGLTEFLPISSSGHLVLVPWIFGWSDFDTAQTAKAFDTALHLGTLAAVLIYLRKDLIIYITQGSQLIFNRKQPATQAGRRAWLLVLSAVPAGIVGAAFEEKITEKLGSPALISVSLIVFGVVLIWADRRAVSKNYLQTVDSLTMRDALVIGVAQVLALNPGTSRSGITITAARLSGFSREAAARLSFLMSVPIIAGAVFFKLAKLVRDGIPDGLFMPMLVGIVVAGISGWLAMWSMIRLVQTKTFAPYVVYRCLIGTGVLIAVASNWR
ncbi:undecaprenyl-diphosphatase [Acidimicrobiaceae bacterium]|nr:undecaprenyl-diphosphatase [Acidimicrobiaceae bacterium]